MKIRTGFVSNSSSSSFVCHCKFSLQEVKNKLELILRFYNELNDTNHKFEDMFAIPFYSDKEYEKSIKYFLELDDYSYVNIKEALIISSVDDNSIPYDLFELIENTFSATRLHLG